MKKYITIDNVRIEMNVYGDNNLSPLILLAGWTHDFQYETQFINALKMKHKVITFSYPGYSGSDSTNKAQSIKYLSSLIDPVAKSAHAEQFTLIGFSMGAQVALSYMENHDKQKATLISPILHSLLHDTPGYGKLLLSSSTLTNLIRNIEAIKIFLINKAYSNIGTVTEGESNSSTFDDNRISLNGAYDTLIATVNSFVDPINYVDRLKFIFGDKEIEKSRLDNHKIKYYTVKDSGHGVFDTKYKEIASLIG